MQRIKAKSVASILGVSVRAVQAMTARGELPSAARIGQVYTYDEGAILRFLAERMEQCASPTCTSEARRGGSGRPSTASNIESRYRQAMSKALGSGGTKGSRKSVKRAGLVRDAHGSRPSPNTLNPQPVRLALVPSRDTP